MYNSWCFLRTRGSGNLIWSILTWSMRGIHMRLGNTMKEAMMSMIVSSDSELEQDKWDERGDFIHLLPTRKGFRAMSQRDFLRRLTWSQDCPRGWSCQSSWSAGSEKIVQSVNMPKRRTSLIRINLCALTGRRMKKKVTPPTSGAWPIRGSKMTLNIPWSWKIQTDVFTTAANRRQNSMREHRTK